MTNEKMTAHVYFSKEVEKDNYTEGCHGGRDFITQDHFTVEFSDTQDLKEELAGWLSQRFDVDYRTCVNELHNECENERFDYNQNEDAEADRMTITKENPDGYLADYSFSILKVTKTIPYTF